MKLRTSLLAATILSIAFTAQARESFYNLGKTEPVISINLGALGALEPVRQSMGGGVLGGGSAPAIVAHPVYDNNTPKPARVQKPKQLHAPMALEPVAKPEIKPVDKPDMKTENMVETKVVEVKPAVTAAPAAPSKPVIDLPPTPPKPVSPAAPSAQIPSVAPGPKLVVTAPGDDAAPAHREEVNKDMPKPAIVPEIAKTPIPPNAESSALRKSDKVVSLPPLSDAAKPAEATAAEMPQNDMTPPPKLIEVKQRAKAAAKTMDDANVATPNFVIPDNASPADEPPAVVKSKKMEEQKTVMQKPAEQKLIASASDKTITMPEKSVTAMAEKETPPKPLMAAKPIVKTMAAPAAPQPELKSIIATAPQDMANNSPPPSPPQNLEKPSLRELPPLSSLYDNKQPLTESSAPAATMPSKDAVIVQPQQLAQASPQTPAPSANGGAALSMVYSEAETELPLSEKSRLDSIAAQLTASKSAHVLVIAYASGTPDQSSQAKRTALARAFAVRSYLLEHNVSAEQMDIKPLGNKSTSGVPDRVDIFLQKSASS